VNSRSKLRPEPNPAAARDQAEFRALLADLKEWAGYSSWKQMEDGAARRGVTLQVSTAQRAVTTDRLPTAELVSRFVAACDGEVQRWCAVRDSLADMKYRRPVPNPGPERAKPDAGGGPSGPLLDSENYPVEEPVENRVPLERVANGVSHTVSGPLVSANDGLPPSTGATRRRRPRSREVPLEVRRTRVGLIGVAATVAITGGIIVASGAVNSVSRNSAAGEQSVPTLPTDGLAEVASAPTAYAPNGAGRTTYQTSNGHYTIYDTRGDRRAVAVIFERANGANVGFQSCHEGAGNDCPGDLPSTVRGELYMATGVGLGSHKSGYTFGPRVRVPGA